MCNHMAMLPAFGDPCARRTTTVRSRRAVHLHGGEVPPELDGGPDSWFTSDGELQGPRLLHRASETAPPMSHRLPLPQHPGGRADLVPRPHPGRHPPERVRRPGGRLLHRGSCIIPTGAATSGTGPAQQLPAGNLHRLRSSRWSSRTACSTPTASSSSRRQRRRRALDAQPRASLLGARSSSGDTIVVNGKAWPT